MTKESEVLSNSSPEVPFESRLESANYTSGAILKASVIAPRDIIDRLPEELLRWLHEDSEQKNVQRVPCRRESELDFESIIVDRLFPLRDNRPFVRRLRLHSQATAVAAGVLAELMGQSTKMASICGWLHDIGLAACLRHADEVFRIEDDDSLAKLWPTIVRSSAQHGIRLASWWRLPSAVRHAIRDHESFVMITAPNPTVANSVVAEHVASLVGYGFHDHAPAMELERALSTLGVGERETVVAASRTERVMRHSRFESGSLRACEGTL